MKKRWPLAIYRLVVSTVVIIIVATVVVSAVPKSGGTVTVIAAVAPHRSIVVNDDLTIIQIYSNTTKEIRPEVYLDKLDGEQVAYSDSITDQYQALKNSINFNEPGLVYERPHGGLGTIFRNIANFFKHLLRL